MRIQQLGIALDEGYRNVLVRETARNFPEMERMETPGDVVLVMEQVFGLHNRAEEYVYLVCMTARGRPVGFFEVSHGTCGFSLVGNREILVRSLLCGAVEIILVHNHPGGDTAPSGADRRVTESLRQACGIVGVRLVDHIIISRSGYCSFREQGILEPVPCPG